MKQFFEEFKEFAIKGNAMSMAVGIIIGSAFTAIVTSLVDDMINPILGLLVRMDFSDLVIQVGDVTIKYGSFIMAVINFVLIAFVLFLLIRTMNRIGSGIIPKKVEEETEPEEKDCPYCMSKIPFKATKCPMCTSELP